jgi:hypothetical protein
MNSVAIPMTKIWSAVASAARHRYGLGMVTMQGTSKAPSPLCFAGALQICCLKSKIPSPSAARWRQAGDGIYFEKRIPNAA